jgi:hypothetical protein
LAAKRARIPWSELCRSIREGTHETKLRELFSQCKHPEQLIPGYVLLSEKMTDMITKDALEVVKKNMKPRGVTEQITADRWVEEFIPKDLLTADHIEAIKVRYMEPSITDCVTLNLK